MTFNRLHKQLFKRRGDLLFFFFVLTCLFSLEGYSEGADLFSAQSLKNLISKRVDLDTSIYLMRSDNQYPNQPDFKQKTSYRIDLTHGIRFHGTWPTLGGDFTGDGHRDLLIARDEKIAIYPKNPDGGLFSKPLTQSGVFTSPFMHIVDLNSDGRDDLLFYEKKSDGKISILLNTGEWKAIPSLEKKSMPSDGK